MRNVAGERGEIKLGSLLTLAVMAFVVYEIYVFAPTLFAQYEFQDAVIEETKFSRGKSVEACQRSLLKKAQELGLPITLEMIKVTREPTKTRIQVSYQLSVEWLPGKPYVWEVHEDEESILF